MYGEQLLMVSMCRGGGGVLVTCMVDCSLASGSRQLTKLSGEYLYVLCFFKRTYHETSVLLYLLIYLCSRLQSCSVIVSV